MWVNYEVLSMVEEGIKFDFYPDRKVEIKSCNYIQGVPAMRLDIYKMNEQSKWELAGMCWTKIPGTIVFNDKVRILISILSFVTNEKKKGKDLDELLKTISDLDHKNYEIFISNTKCEGLQLKERKAPAS